MRRQKPDISHPSLKQQHYQSYAPMENAGFHLDKLQHWPGKKTLQLTNNWVITPIYLICFCIISQSMNFISSTSFLNKHLISWTFLGHFCHHFWVGATVKQQQTHPKVMTKMIKKCSTNQRFIWERNTTLLETVTLVKKPHILHHSTINLTPSFPVIRQLFECNMNKSVFLALQNPLSQLCAALIPRLESQVIIFSWLLFFRPKNLGQNRNNVTYFCNFLNLTIIIW